MIHAHSTGRQRGATSAAVIAGSVVIVLGALGLWWFTGGDEGEAIDTDRLVSVELRDLLHAVNASGRVEPLARVAVMSRASGILEKILVEEGDVVEKGQVLAELDREQLEAQYAQDQADLSAAEARVQAAAARLAEARVRLNDPALEFAQRDAERLEHLYQQGDVSQKERDDAARARAALEFELTQAEASLPVLEAAVLEADAGLAGARADLDRSQTALREATIRSPIDGVVLFREKEVGDGVSSILTAGGNATQILILGDLSEMYIEARVDEVDLGRIHQGMDVVVTVDAHRGRTLQGQVQRIAPAGSVDDNGIVTFEVRITVADPEGLLRPDMTADAKLVIERKDGVPSLPQRALFRNGPQWMARVVDGDAVVPTPVGVGLSDGLMTEITEGLAVGDQVMLPEGGAPGRGWP